MTPEEKAAYINAQAAALNATVAGMVATNLLLSHQGEAPQYTLEDFESSIAMYNCHHNQLIQFIHS